MTTLGRFDTLCQYWWPAKSYPVQRHVPITFNNGGAPPPPPGMYIMYNAGYSVRVDTIERNIVKDWNWNCSLPKSPQKNRVLNGLGITNSRTGHLHGIALLLFHDILYIHHFRGIDPKVGGGGAVRPPPENIILPPIMCARAAIHLHVRSRFLRAARQIGIWCVYFTL